MPKDHRQLVNDIASDRIAILYRLAEARAHDNTPESILLARSYVKKIKKISTHYKVKLPIYIKDSICKKCSSLLVPGLNAHVRIASVHSYIIIKCDNCGTEKHIMYKAPKRAHTMLT